MRTFMIFVMAVAIVLVIGCFSLLGLLAKEEASTCYTSWYSNVEYPESMMANGEVFNDNDLTCASWDYPFGTRLLVTRIDNGADVQVRVTDRGPRKDLYDQGRKLDLSRRAFAAIADLKQGLVEVRVEKL